MSETVTINIESTDLRFLVSDGSQIKRWGSVPLNPGVIREGLILNPQALSAAISELIASKQLSKGKVIASLSGFKSVHRIVDLPRMPSKLLGEAILAEAKRAMPVSLDQIYLSWQNISGKKDEVQRFFLLGVPQNMLDVQLRCLRQAGINPGKINLKPVALARMVNHAEALIIDIEPESCTIIVVAGGIPTIMRSLATNPDYSPADRAQYVLQEFERTLQFYESSCLDNPLNQETPIFLTGALANQADLHQAIAAGTGRKVEPLKCPLQCPPDFPVAQFAVNIGLALSGTSVAAKQAAKDGRFLITDLNLLPNAYHPKGLPTRQLLYAAGIAAGIALIFPLYQIVNSAAAEDSQLRSTNDQFEQQLAIRQAKGKQASQQIKELNQEIEKINKSIVLIDSEKQAIPDIADTTKGLQTQRQRNYDALCLAIGLLPQNINLSSISQASDGIDLAGGASVPGDTGGSNIGFTISLKIRDASGASVKNEDSRNELQIGSDPLYEGYWIVLDYANSLRGRVDWFANVQLHFMSSGESSDDSANQNPSINPVDSGNNSVGEGVDPGFFPGGIPQSGPSFLNSMTLNPN